VPQPPPPKPAAPAVAPQPPKPVAPAVAAQPLKLVAPAVAAQPPKPVAPAAAPPPGRPVVPVAAPQPKPAVAPPAAAVKAPAGMTPAAEPAKVKGKFTLHLNTFASADEASAFAHRYPGAFVVSGEVPGRGMAHRVRYGNFPTYKDATSAKESFEKQHGTIALVAAR
jgi:hypothetical protein